MSAQPVLVGCARVESEACIVDGMLSISVSVATLCHAARNSNFFFDASERGTPLVITDENDFAKSVRRALNREAEDGSTPITRLLEAAFEYVAEQGEDGIDELPVSATKFEDSFNPRVTQAELSALLASPANRTPLSFEFGPGWVELKDVEGNNWARKHLAEIRAKEKI